MLNVDYVYIDALRAFTRASYRKVKLYFTSKLIEHNKYLLLIRGPYGMSFFPLRFMARPLRSWALHPSGKNEDP